MKVRHECVNRSLYYLYNVYKTEENFPCRMLLSSTMIPNLNFKSSDTLKDFLPIFRSKIVKKAYQVIVLDEDQNNYVRLTFIQQNEMEIVRVYFPDHIRKQVIDGVFKGRFDFHTVHETPHEFAQFIYCNSHALITYETFLKRQALKDTSITPSLLAPITPSTVIETPGAFQDNKSRCLISRMIRFIEKDGSSDTFVCAIPFYKEETSTPWKTTRMWMTNVLFIREPYNKDEGIFRLTVVDSSRCASFIYKKGSYAFKPTKLTNNPDVLTCIQTKDLYLRTSGEVLMYRELYSKSRPTSKYLEIY